MQLQDSFCIGFELGGGHFALPVQQVFGVFHDTNAARESKLLRLEDVLVYEGSPVCMRSARQLIPELMDYCDEAQMTEITPQNHPWVLILKDDAISRRKGPVKIHALLFHVIEIRCRI